MFAKKFLLTYAILIVVCVLGRLETMQNELVHSNQSASPTPSATPSRTPTRPRSGPISPYPGGVHAMVNFDGTWMLDKSRSQGLSPRLLSADKVVWNIKQDNQEISIGQKIVGDGLAGGTGARAGAGNPRPSPSLNPSIYKLDGSETAVDIGSGRGTSTLKAAWFENTLNLVRKSILKNPEGDVVLVETRTLELSKDGKTLTVKVQNESPRGTTNLNLVFNLSN